MTQFEVGVRLTADGKGLVGAAREAEQALDRVGQAAERASAKTSGGAERPRIGAGAGDATKKEAAEAEAALKKLLATLDPVYAKQVKFEQGQAVIARALKAGVIDQQQYNLGLANLEARLGLIEPKLSGLSRAKALAVGAIGGFVGGLASSLPATVLSFLDRTIDKIAAIAKWGAELDRTARSINVTSQQLQELTLIGQRFGLTEREMTQGLERFQQKLAEAAAKKPEIVDLFRQLGLSPTDATGRARSVVDALPQLMQALAQFSRSDRLLIGERLFGRDAEKFIQMLDQGPEKIERLRQSFAKGVVGQETVKELRDAHELAERISNESAAQMRAGFASLAAPLVIVREILTDINNLMRIAVILNPAMLGYVEINRKAKRDDSVDDNNTPAGRFRAMRDTGGAEEVSRRYRPPGGGGRSDEVRRILDELGLEGSRLAAEIRGGKLAASWEELLEKLTKAKASAEQLRDAMKLFDDNAHKRGVLTLQEMEREHRRNVEAIEAEIAGNRDLVETIRLKGQIEAQHGKAFADAHGARIAALAAEKVAVERSAEQYRALTGEIVQFAGSALSALNDAAVRPFEAGERAAKRWLDTLTRGLQDLQRLLYQLAVVNPIQNWLDGGGRPTISTLFGRLFGGLFGGGGGGVDAVPDALRGDVMHVGGIVGGGGAPGRLVPALAFAGAPRLHDGGLLPGERPAILRDGEGVFTPRQMSNADGLVRALALMAQRGDDGRVSVAIYDQRTGSGRAEASAEQSRGAGGDREIRVFLRDAVREGIARGDYDGVAGQAWGVTRRGAGR